MKLTNLVKVFLFVSVFTLSQISLDVPANAGVTDCLDVGSPYAALSSSSLTIQASVSVRCTKDQLGSGSGFVYSVEGEGFGAQCDGPNYVMSGSTGTMRCTIPVGGTLGSSRFGATRTTIKIWSSWDFSTKFISATHQAIPVKTTPVPTTSSPGTPIPSPAPVVSTKKCAKPESADLKQELENLKGLILDLYRTAPAYKSETDNLLLEADYLTKKSSEEICVTASSNIDSQLNLAVVNTSAELITKLKSLLASTTSLVLEIQKNPMKKMTITCFKSKSSKKITAVNPKCPKGYKVKV